jgi:DNA adenine methylase
LKTKTKKIDSPLKYHGGKSYLASKIVALMPQHTHYVEPYAGGLSVLLAKDPDGVSEVVNDKWGALTSFWNCMMNPELFERFKRMVDGMPFAESLWKTAAAAIDLDNLDIDDVDKAAAFFVTCRQSLAGRMQDFATLSRRRTRRGMNEQASAWLTAVEGLAVVHERMKRVVVLNRDALDVIMQQDGAATLFYLDPPYAHETRANTGEYMHEMSFEDHMKLLATLSAIKGKFLLSGYRSESYDKVAKVAGWNRKDFSLPNNSAGGKVKRRMTECVWMNF